MDTPTETPLQVVISGYYGFDNLGDELILRVLYQELSKRNVRLTVLSRNPEKTVEAYEGMVRAIPRMNLTSIIEALSKAHLFISGGGGLFQDATGPVSPAYYGGLIRLADFFALPVLFFGQGVGPLNRPTSRWMTGQALQVCRAITVRDLASLELVQALMPKTGHCLPEVTADPVWLLEVPQHAPQAEPDAIRVGISLRTWPDMTPERIRHMAQTLKAMEADLDCRVIYTLYPLQEAQDRPVLEQLETALRAIKADSETEWIPTHEIVRHIGSCHRFFGMRFHSLILAILAGVPVYGLIYDPKVQSLLESLELKGISVSELEQLNWPELQPYFSHYSAPCLESLKAKAALNLSSLDRVLAEIRTSPAFVNV